VSDAKVVSNIISVVGSYVPIGLKAVKVVMEDVVSFQWNLFFFFLLFLFNFDGYCSGSSILLGVLSRCFSRFFSGFSGLFLGFFFGFFSGLLLGFFFIFLSTLF
jgi:hypothetical protein